MHTRTMETEEVGKTKPQYIFNYKRYKTLKYAICPIHFPSTSCLQAKFQTGLSSL